MNQAKAKFVFCTDLVTCILLLKLRKILFFYDYHFYYLIITLALFHLCPSNSLYTGLVPKQQIKGPDFLKPLLELNHGFSFRL